MYMCIHTCKLPIQHTQFVRLCRLHYYLTAHGQSLYALRTDGGKAICAHNNQGLNLVKK